MPDASDTKPAPQPEGKLWLGHAILPGWQTGAKVDLTDPRSPAPSPQEVGRGPLPEALGRRFLAALQNTPALAAGQLDAQRPAVGLLAQADLDLRGAKEWPEELVMEVLVARLSRLAGTARR